MLRIVLFLIVVRTVAYAETGRGGARRAPSLPCFLSFASASPSETPPRDLILRTYGELFDTLGGPGLSPEKIDRLAAAENPFAPPELDADLGSLRRRLRELEGMLARRGWLTDDVRNGARDLLRGRAAGARAAVETRHATIATTWPDLPIAIPGAPHFLITPADGRYVLTHDPSTSRPSGTPIPFYVYDTHAKKLTPIPGSNLARVGQQLSTDGKSLLIPVDGAKLLVVPFEKGILHWDKAGEPIAPAEAPSTITGTPAVTSDNSRVYLGLTDPGRPPLLFAVDPVGRSNVPLTVDGVAVGRKLDFNSWGVIPKTSQLYFTVPNGDKVTLAPYSFDAAGKGTALPGAQVLPYAAGDTYSWTPNGKVLQTGFDKITLYTTPTTPVSLEVPPPYEMGRSPISRMVFHPKKNEVAILMNPEKDKMRLDWFSTETGEKLRTTSLPNRHYSYIKMSDDGRNLFIYTSVNEIVLVNPYRESPR